MWSSAVELSLAELELSIVELSPVQRFLMELCWSWRERGDHRRCRVQECWGHRGGCKRAPAWASNCEQLTTSLQWEQRMPEAPPGAGSMTTTPVSSCMPLDVRYSTASPSCADQAGGFGLRFTLSIQAPAWRGGCTWKGL